MQPLFGASNIPTLQKTSGSDNLF